MVDFKKKLEELREKQLQRIGGLKKGELSVFAASHNTGRSMLSHEYLDKSTVSTYLKAREAASNIIKGV